MNVDLTCYCGANMKVEDASEMVTQSLIGQWFGMHGHQDDVFVTSSREVVQKTPMQVDFRVADVMEERK